MAVNEKYSNERCKGCPFCGVKPEITKHHIDPDYTLRHRCKVMGNMQLESTEYPELAINTWNSRFEKTWDEVNDQRRQDSVIRGGMNLGVGVIVQNEKNQVLLGLRTGAEGEGTWCFPGGGVQLGETLEEAAHRELDEETDLKVHYIKMVQHTTEVVDAAGTQWHTFFFQGKYCGGEVKLKEPNKCLEWRWFDWDHLPEPLFRAMTNLMAKDFHPSDWINQDLRNGIPN